MPTMSMPVQIADHTDDDHRIAEAEFLDRNPVDDRQQARQHEDDPGDEQST